MSNINTQNRLGEEPITKLLFQFAVPAIIGMVVNMLYNVVDRIYIGNIPDVGALAITGVGITMPITSIITGIGMLIGTGAAANLSLTLGIGNKEKSAQYVGNAFTLVVIASLLVAVIGNIFAPQIVGAFGASESTTPYALDYLRILMFGTIFNLCAFSLNNLIRSDGNPKIAMNTMLIGAIVNIVLDPIFIFGFGLGIKGAAIATVLSQTVSASWVLFYFIKSKKCTTKLKLSNIKLRKTIVMSTLAIGMAPFGMQVAGSLVQMVSNNALMTHGGDLAIGAMAVITSVCTIFVMPLYGINQGTQPIIGYNYGAKKYKRVMQAYRYSLIASTTILILSWLFIMFIPDKAIGLFNNDPQLSNIAVYGIRIFLFALPVIGIQMIGSTYYQAVGKAKISMMIGLSRQVLILIPLFLILPNFLGLDGIWLAGPIADVISAIIGFIVIRKEFKKLKELENVESEVSPIAL
ncbi:MATE family efflux transporter [Romboutsia sp.]|uniref:MATE family efflux transporter n=1 Tax=Romboutsia sp. TaxID=1965302 RepID=UPI003F38A639